MILRTRAAVCAEHGELIVSVAAEVSDIVCPREKSAMTPCIARDGYVAEVGQPSAPNCVGCGISTQGALQAFLRQHPEYTGRFLPKHGRVQHRADRLASMVRDYSERTLMSEPERYVAVKARVRGPHIDVDAAHLEADEAWPWAYLYLRKDVETAPWLSTEELRAVLRVLEGVTGFIDATTYRLDDAKALLRSRLGDTDA